MTNNKNVEHVLCIDSKYIPKGNWYVLGHKLDTQNFYFINRQNAEKNIMYKQLIPYIIVTRDKKILEYTRTKKSGESRLINQCSIGFGGHININDYSANLEHTINNGIKRELSEELNIKNYKKESLKYLGMINDDNNEVGKVHLGLVYLFDNNQYSNKYKIDDTISSTNWIYYDQVLKNKNDKNFESWSYLAAQLLNDLVYYNDIDLLKIPA